MRRGGGGGLVETNGKWHIAGPREGEAYEEVDNLDPGMNDPLPLGARGIPLSRRPSLPSATLAHPFHPLFEPTRRRLRRDPFLSPPFHFPFHSLFAHHPLLPPFLALWPSSSPCCSPSPLPPPLEAAPFLFRILVAAHPSSRASTLALHANLSRGGWP